MCEDSPYRVDTVLELLHITSAGNEVRHSIEGRCIPRFKAFRVMQDKKTILIRSEFLLDVRFSRFEIRNGLNPQSVKQVDGEGG